MTQRPRRRTASRRAFTLVEVMVAGFITTLVLGSMSLSLGKLGRAKNTCKERFDAYLRADAGLNTVRRDLVTVIRTDDLFYTRLLILDDSVESNYGTLARDEILVFNTRLRPVRDVDHFTGEGMEYETQYRIEEDELGPVLWQRRDALPDEYPLGGGVAMPLVEGVLGLSIEAYDGKSWHEEWDSDVSGLPTAVRVTLTANGHRSGEDVYEKTLVHLRTVIPMDRVLQPRDHFEIEEELLRERDALDAAEQAPEAGGGLGAAAPEAGEALDGGETGGMGGGAGGGAGSAGRGANRGGGGADGSAGRGLNRGGGGSGGSGGPRSGEMGPPGSGGGGSTSGGPR